MKKKIVLILSLILTIVMIIFLWDIFKTLLTEEGRIAFQGKVNDMGIFGMLVIIGLTVSQVFLAILPGEPVELLAGMCYGTVGGLILIYIGVFISNCIIFFLVRKVGKASIYNLISKEKVEKIEKSKFYSNKHAENILLLMFGIPGTPKDILVYFGALLPINAKKFIILSTLIRFPTIITSTIVGDSFAVGNTKFGIIVYVITFVVSVVGLLLYSKRQYGKEIMEIDKAE